MAKILVVDDNPINRSFLVTLLGYRGHDLIEASDGAEALFRVVAERPDLVIADILMPKMDGFEFVRQLRANLVIAQTPVIFCTAHFYEREAHELARDCGVAEVLTKPCEPDVVLRAVDACLGSPIEAGSSLEAEDFDRGHLRLLTDKLSVQTEELAAVNRRLEALIATSLQLSSECQQSALLERFCGSARELIPAKYAIAVVTSSDAEGKTPGDCRNPHVLYASGLDDPAASRLREAPPPCADFFHLAKNGRPVRLANPGGRPDAVGLPSVYPDFGSLLAAPITSRTCAYGWLVLLQHTGGVAFSAEDERLASIMAALVGRIYENRIMYSAAQRHAEELEREIAVRKRAEEERDAHEAALDLALAGKEVLLREVHHRVKNNLQVISSLLALQAESLPDGARNAIDESQRRVRSMALIHEQLHTNGNEGRVDFREYTRSLTTELLGAYGSNPGVHLRLDLDPVQLEMNQATPCGLILNEIMTNSLKYAFPNARAGEILVSLRRDSGGKISLRVADNGIGLPPGFQWTQSPSLGLRIVDILTRQLDGNLHLEPGEGTDFTLNFVGRSV